MKKLLTITLCAMCILGKPDAKAAPEIVDIKLRPATGATFVDIYAEVLPYVEYMLQYKCGGIWRNYSVIISYDQAVVIKAYRVDGWTSCYGYDAPSGANWQFRLVEIDRDQQPDAWDITCFYPCDPTCQCGKCPGNGNFPPPPAPVTPEEPCPTPPFGPPTVPAN